MGENTGRWSTDEHERFLKAIEKYGSNWKMVEKEVRTRTATQCRSHAQKHFLKMEKNESQHMDFTAKPVAETTEIAV
jgi:SHAQKYF class myb-like DNA-binding protein